MGRHRRYDQEPPIEYLWMIWVGFGILAVSAILAGFVWMLEGIFDLVH